MENSGKGNFLRNKLAALAGKKQSALFVVVNMLVAFVGFTRSFVFMKVFGFFELGMITLILTASMFIGFMHIGLINGGYRIIALGKEDLSEKINNVMFSFLGVLFLVLVAGAFIGVSVGLVEDWKAAAIVCLVGISMLINNWLTNTLIGASRFDLINVANSISAVISFGTLYLAYKFGLYGAFICILSQPLTFVIIVLIKNKKLWPTGFLLELGLIKYILSFGFIPFLSGMFMVLYMQLERWSVNGVLGAEALGKMYLFTLVTTLWVLVPTSINSLFFPRAVKLYADGMKKGLVDLINRYFLVIIGYSVLGVLGAVLLLNPVVEQVFPNHLPYTTLVYIALPGLCLRVLGDPITLLLNSIVKLKPIFWSDVASTLMYAVVFGVLIYTDHFSITTVVLAFVIYNAVKFLYLLAVYAQLRIKGELKLENAVP